MYVHLLPAAGGATRFSYRGQGCCAFASVLSFAWRAWPCLGLDRLCHALISFLKDIEERVLRERHRIFPPASSTELSLRSSHRLAGHLVFHIGVWGVMPLPRLGARD